MKYKKDKVSRLQISLLATDKPYLKNLYEISQKTGITVSQLILNEIEIMINENQPSIQ